MNIINNNAQKKKRKIILIKNRNKDDLPICKPSFILNSTRDIERNKSNILNPQLTYNNLSSKNTSKIIEHINQYNNKKNKVISIEPKEEKIMKSNKSFTGKKFKHKKEYNVFDNLHLKVNFSFSHKKSSNRKNIIKEKNKDLTINLDISNADRIIKKYTFNKANLTERNNNAKREILNKVKKSKLKNFIKDDQKNKAHNITFSNNINNNNTKNIKQNNFKNELSTKSSKKSFMTNYIKVNKNKNIKSIFDFDIQSNSITTRTIIFNMKEQNENNINDFKKINITNNKVVLYKNKSKIINKEKVKNIIKEKSDNKISVRTTKKSLNSNANTRKKKIYLNKKEAKDNLDVKSNMALLKSKLEKYRTNESKPVFSYSTSFSEQINSGNDNENGLKKILKKIKFNASLSKKGKGLPEEPEKINQDNLFKVKFENLNLSFYGVCDGHGDDGHLISKFISTSLPYFIYEELKKNTIYNNINSYISKIFENVFLQLNSLLINNKEINSAFSGTTCISLLLCSNQIISCNLGDSRAIKGQLINNKWSFELLSRDHKPNEPDEMKRIKENKGIIKPYIDENGEVNGPDRIWLPNQTYPGIAMSRSFGDQVAAQIGVVAIPEILFFPYIEEDKFIIIASDGLWEYVSNQEVVDIVGKYYNKNDCDNAIKELYETAFERWRNNNIFIDDISIILIYLE